MAAHSTLTGADLHEPKGVAAAAANLVYVSNGSGSGSWTSVPASSVSVLDSAGDFTGTTVETVLTEINNKPLFTNLVMADVSAISTVLVPLPFSCTVTSIEFVLGSGITVANSGLTITRSDGAAMGTQAIAYVGSVEGTTFVFTPSGNNVLTYPTHNYIKIVSDGNSTTTAPLYISVSYVRT